jgi:hypothetical protein
MTIINSILCFSLEPVPSSVKDKQIVFNSGSRKMKRKIIVVTAAYGSEQINAMGGQRPSCRLLPAQAQTAWRSAANCSAIRS